MLEHKFQASPTRRFGFTLIELLITMSLLTSLLFTGTYAYSLISSRWDKELGHFNQAAENAKNLELLQKVLSGIYPSAVYKQTKEPAFLFVGGEDRIISVTRSGIFDTQHPEIFKLIFEPKEDGRLDLIYQAVSTKKLFLLGAGQSIKFENQITLFENLSANIINYYGWADYKLKEQSAETGLRPQWTKKYSGLDTKLLPEKVTVKFTNEQGSISIPVTLQHDTEFWWTRYQRRDI